MSYSTPYSAFRDVIAHYNADRPEEEQLPAIPLHDLRHTSATPMLSKRMSIKTENPTPVVKWQSRLGGVGFYYV